jgi:hypothetical protein
MKQRRSQLPVLSAHLDSYDNLIYVELGPLRMLSARRNSLAGNSKGHAKPPKIGFGKRFWNVVTALVLVTVPLMIGTPEHGASSNWIPYLVIVERQAERVGPGWLGYVVLFTLYIILSHLAFISTLISRIRIVLM